MTAISFTDISCIFHVSPTAITAQFTTCSGCECELAEINPNPESRRKQTRIIYHQDPAECLKTNTNNESGPCRMSPVTWVCGHQHIAVPVLRGSAFFPKLVGSEKQTGVRLDRLVKTVLSLFQ